MMRGMAVISGGRPPGPRSSVALPAGFSERAPRLADAEAILELVTAYNTPIVGFADYTLDDVRDELVEPGFDIDEDGWLVFDGSGALVGYGWACRDGSSDIVNVDAVAEDPQVARWLLERTLDRARAIGREHRYPQVTVDQGIYRANEPMRELSSAYGFVPSTTYHRMRVDHTGPVPMPEPPPGLVVRTGDQGEAARRAAYDVVMSSFADHFGHVETRYDEWHEQRAAKSTFDWSQLVVLELDGRPVAMSECTSQFVEDEGCGYVAKLGVVAQARGRGLAKYLLRRAFAVDAAAGLTGTILHVDTNNTTPALGLYESVGMKPVLVIDVWRQVLSTT
jgi:mycothiol synthase